MSYIPNNAMPHAYDEDTERPAEAPEGERSIFRWVSEKARNNPRTAISAGAAILAGAVAAVAIPLMGGEERKAKPAKSATRGKAAAKSKPATASKAGTARTATRRKSSASAAGTKSTASPATKSGPRTSAAKRKTPATRSARSRKSAPTEG